LAQFFCQLALILVVVEVRDVDQAGSLLANGLHNPGMSMAQGIHPQTGYEVEVSLALKVEKKHALATFEGYWVAVVGLKQILLLAFDNRLKVFHGFSKFYLMNLGTTSILSKPGSNI
jgi:hypothetical protein